MEGKKKLRYLKLILLFKIALTVKYFDFIKNNRRDIMVYFILKLI